MAARLLGRCGAAVVVTATTWILLARLRWRMDVGHTTICALSSAYVNAGNLGIPIAAYALGNAALVAPMLLVQLLVLLSSSQRAWLGSHASQSNLRAALEPRSPAATSITR